MSEFNADAERTARRLDQALPPHSAHVPAASDDPLVMTALRLANTSAPELSPSTRARIEARVLAVYDNANGQHTRPRAMMLLLRSVAILVLVVGVVTLTGIPALAASLPGDEIYPIKQAVEQIELALSLSESARLETHLRQAARRLDEAYELLQREQFNPSIIEAALSGITQAASLLDRSVISDPAPIESRVVLMTSRAITLLNMATMTDETQPGVMAALLTDADALLDRYPPEAESEPPEIVTVPSPTSVVTALPTSTAIPSSTATQVPTETPESLAPSSITPMPSPTPFVAYVHTSSSANVRSGPGIHHQVISSLRPGTRVIVVGRDQTGEWQHVQLADFSLGWIAAFLLRDQPLPPYSTQGEADAGASSEFPRPVQSGQNGQPDQPQPPFTGEGDGDCDTPGTSCYAPGRSENLPPGQGGEPPGQRARP